jgi:hypothetical protein
MSAISISVPFPTFYDLDGQSLDNGYLYVGALNQNPEVYPIQLFWDAAMTIPAAQPVRTIEGYPSRSGTPARLYANVADYSITVRDHARRLVYTALSDTQRLPASAITADDGDSGSLWTSVQGFVNYLLLTGSLIIGFIQDAVGAVTRTVADKFEEQGFSVLDFGAVADWSGVGGTNLATALDLAISALPNFGGLIFIPPGEYHLASEVVINGNSDATNFAKKIQISAYGAKIYYTGSAEAFTFLDVNYPEFLGAQIFLVNDTVGVVGVQLKHSRWGRYEADIFNGSDEVSGAGVNNTAWKLQSGPSDTFDNLYNMVKGRIRKTGLGILLANDDNLYSRNNANTFDNKNGATNGIRIEGCQGNTFRGSLETGTGIPIALKLNASSLPSKYNTFDFGWMEAPSATAWTSDTDTGCDHNDFFIRSRQFSTFWPDGNQHVYENGAGSSSGEIPSTLVLSEEQYEAAINGGHQGGINRLSSTEDFSNAAWTKTNTTVVVGAVALPDGTTVSDKNTVALTAANGTVNTSFSVNSSGKMFTGAVWLRAATPHVARLQLYSDAGGGSGLTKSIYVTRKWQRFFLTFQFSASAGTSVGFFIYPGASGIAAGSIEVWGAQVNEGYLGAYTKMGTNATVRDLGARGYLASRGGVITPFVAFGEYKNAGTTINNYRIMGIALAAPVAGTWQQGDRLSNANPAVGSAKGWICTVSGTPGTWVSEGNL